MAERRKTQDRREQIEDRRQSERRKVERRRGRRRNQFCPRCGVQLDQNGYCSTCKVRVIRIRN